MILTVSLGVKRDMTGGEVALLDRNLRKAVPELVGWSYSSLTGELTLDFGEAEDNALLGKIEGWLLKAGGIKKLRFEILGMLKEWEG